MSPLMEKTNHPDSRPEAARGHRETDAYEVLNEYIMEINPEEEIHNLLVRASNCMGKISGHRLAALAIPGNGSIGAWSIPGIRERSVKRWVTGDPTFGSDLHVDCMNRAHGETAVPFPYDEKAAVTRHISGDGFTAGLYMIPGNRGEVHDSELIDIVIHILCVALSNRLKLKQSAQSISRDPLDQWGNRGEFEEQLVRYAANAARHKHPLSIVIVELINPEKYGNTDDSEAGEAALERIARRMRADLGTGDLLYRYGETEFIALLPETTRENAAGIGERLKRELATIDTEFGEASMGFGVNFSVAALDSGSSGECMLKEVAGLCFKARAGSRNRVGIQ